jgi:phenylalanyl-tRNA synthetase beta chain
MKLIYSELQKLLPSLNVKPQQLRDDLTMIGHFTNFYEEIEGEIVFDMDIKVNRGDCLGYYGLARDLSVYYNIPLNIPIFSSVIASETKQSHYNLPINVSTNNVKRVMAVKISEIKNSQSPEWLKKFVKIHGSNSVNTLVDLTNYIMFLYGIPNHAFDTAKSGDNLIWEMNSKFQEFVSLDGSKLSIDKNILMVNNPQKTLSLSFWGGESCAINLDTNETIIELAVYDRTTVRKNSRQLKSVTEASIRLEKDLDPELIPQAFNHLTNLILENCGGKISSNIYDYYPEKVSLPEIEFDSSKPSLVSGIEISADFSIDCLKRLGCVIKNNLIIPPSIRKDIGIEADLIEEVVLFYGYNKIPINQPLIYKKLPDITPKEIYLIEELKDKLVNLGYDEILSWPLANTPYDQDNVITTQNSINSEYIYLRQSLIQSLTQQLDQYNRYKLPNPQFFEIGKIFYQENGKYIEKNSLGIYNYDSNKLIEDLKKLNLEGKIIDNNFVEIILDDLEKPDLYIPKTENNNAYELTSQIITLDANVILEKKEDEKELINKYSQIIGNKYLWQMVITDSFEDKKTGKFKYTFRVSYFNTDDKTAKALHLKSFNLESFTNP